MLIPYSDGSGIAERTLTTVSATLNLISIGKKWSAKLNCYHTYIFKG